MEFISNEMDSTTNSYVNMQREENSKLCNKYANYNKNELKFLNNYDLESKQKPLLNALKWDDYNL